jgi:dCMP deaminase
VTRVLATRISRDEYGLALVEVVKLRAACTRRQVGAVILDADGRIAATGYNGTKAKATHCTDGGCPRGAFDHTQIAPNLGNGGHQVPCVAKHAEWNAICWALDQSVHLPTSTMYVSTEPCPDCFRLAHGVGLNRILWRHKISAVDW